MFIILKPNMHGRAHVVTAIKQGGLRIDNAHYDPDARFDARCIARQFKTRAAADKALGQMASVGGFDDYQVEAYG